jgi:antitoxin HigA-1
LARKQQITPFGWEVKKRLAELQMTQTEFCEKEGIPANRLSEIISGTNQNKGHLIRYRKLVAEILDIEIKEVS